VHAYSTADGRTPALGTIAFVAVIIAIGANAAFALLSAAPAWLVSAPTVAASFGLVYRFVDRIAWRWSILRFLGVIQVPKIEGTYRGKLVSSYRQIELPISICIDQSWSRIAIRFDVDKPKSSSSSYSVTAGLGQDGHQRARLTYTYRNQTRPGVADVDMNDHDGTAEVVVDESTGVMTGRYYNFRGRQGTMELTRV
jgi:hypothetical protein